ncbi:MAG: SDR family oxidoreductase [Gemmatimonadetes bacterium]|nr:SDR family oxidoreductase [Gemmatimonadota bacterium]
MKPAEGLRIYDGAVAIVTGAASGIGRAMAEELAGRGATVVLADRHLDDAQEAATQIQQRGLRASATELDVTDHAAVQALVVSTLKQYGRLDYMINNAGVNVGGEALTHAIDDWRRVLDVNIAGVVHGVHAAYPVMVEQGFGHIVNTASLAGLVPFLEVCYTTSKYAVVGLSLSLRKEAARRGVRVSVLCPGAVSTPLLKEGLPETGVKAGSALERRARGISAQYFAQRALASIARNRAIVLIPRRGYVFWIWNRLRPSSRFLGMPFVIARMKLAERSSANGGRRGSDEYAATDHAPGPSEDGSS